MKGMPAGIPFIPRKTPLRPHSPLMARKTRPRKGSSDERQLQLFTMEEMTGENVLSPSIDHPDTDENHFTDHPHEMDEHHFTDSYHEKDEHQEMDEQNEMDEHRLLQSMRRALMILSRLKGHQIRLIAMESATLAQEGISSDRVYRIPALEGMSMNGYDFQALYYASFAQAFPSMIDRINLPFSDVYEQALRPHQTNS